MTTVRDSRTVRWAEAIYRTGLRWFRFRVDPDFELEAIEMFRDRAREDRRDRGRVAVGSTLVRALLDLTLAGRDRPASAAAAPGSARTLPKESRMKDLALDVRYAVRRWLRLPAYSLTAIGTLALGIGMAAAMFSVVNGVLLRPLPFAEPDRVVMVWDSNLSQGRPRFPTSPANLEEWSHASTAFSGLSGYLPSTATLAEGPDPVRLSAVGIRTNLFEVLGTPVTLGRGFVEAEGTSGQDDVVILSARVWSERFGRDPDILSRTLTINGRPRTVVGVIDASGTMSPEADLWLPLTFDFDIFQARGARFIRVVGRLAPGISLETAQSQMDVLSASLADAYPANRGWKAALVPVYDQLLGSTETVVRVLAVAVGLLLLMVCANVLNLHIAYASTRGREFALRRALGAGVGRLMRLTLVESMMLAVVSALAGVGIAAGLTQMLSVLGATSLPRAENVAVDGQVLWFSAALAMFVGLAMGGITALHASRHQRMAAAGGLQAGASAQGRRLRTLVVVADVAVALVLLAGFGLVGRSLAGLLSTDLGFVPTGLVSGSVTAPASRYPETEQRAQFHDLVAERLRALPAIDSVTVTTRLPLMGPTTFGYVVDRDPLPPMSAWTPGLLRAVDPAYFETLSVPLRQGRLFDDRDTADARPVVIISEAMARDLNLGGALLGTRIRISSGDVACPCEIVGVVGDVRETTIDAASIPSYYLPQTQSVWTTRNYVVRSSAPLATVAAAMRSALASVDPSVPFFDIQPVERLVDQQLTSPRFNSMLLGIFAVLGLVLTSVGIYGVTTFVVSRRMPELAVRAALGANPAALVWLVQREALMTTVAGLGIGLAGTVATTRYLSSLLVDVSPLDTVVLAGSVGFLALLGAGAALAPAMRAGRADPVRTLRND